MARPSCRRRLLPPCVTHTRTAAANKNLGPAPRCVLYRGESVLLSSPGAASSHQARPAQAATHRRPPSSLPPRQGLRGLRGGAPRRGGSGRRRRRLKRGGGFPLRQKRRHTTASLPHRPPPRICAAPGPTQPLPAFFRY
jgi:hypothetical protein